MVSITIQTQVSRKIKSICENILQPVRDHFGRVKVTSVQNVCLKIGSHQQPTCPCGSGGLRMRVDNAELLTGLKNLDYDQLILEFYTPGEPNKWMDTLQYYDHQKTILTHTNQRVKLNTNL